MQTDPTNSLFRLPYVSYVFDSIMRGIFEYRGQGSKPFEVDYNETSRRLGREGFYMNVLNSSFRPVIRSIESKEIAIANYTGTVLPVIDALILAVCALLVFIAVRICIKDPPGLGWEVLAAHGRKCADELLSGPDAVVELTRSRQINNPKSCYIGYGVPMGFHPVEDFVKDDIVEATPLNPPFERIEED